MSATRIILFAKAPLPGRVKTRLIPTLGASGAAMLARRMLMQTLAAAVAARVGIVELCTSPGFLHADWGFDFQLPIYLREFQFHPGLAGYQPLIWLH